MPYPICRQYIKMEGRKRSGYARLFHVRWRHESGIVVWLAGLRESKLALLALEMVFE